MIKSIIKLILLIFLISIISISPRTRYILGISLKQISSFLLWSVKDEHKEKWIIDKPGWFPSKNESLPIRQTSNPD